MISTNPELSPREATAVVARRLAQITPRQQPVRIAGALPLAVLLGGPTGLGEDDHPGARPDVARRGPGRGVRLG